MNNDRYSDSVMRTWKKKHRNLSDYEMQIANAAFGLVGEAGELADHIKKFLFHDIPLEMTIVEKEVGDVRYYLVAFETLMGLTAEQVQESNSKKLQLRYPKGFVAGGGIRDAGVD